MRTKRRSWTRRDARKPPRSRTPPSEERAVNDRGQVLSSARAAVPRTDLHCVARLIVPTIRQPQFACIEERAMGDSRNEAQARAEAKFEKQQTAEHKAQAQAVDAKTARLRSLRLDKEAADKEAKAKAKPAESSG